MTDLKPSEWLKLYRFLKAENLVDRVTIAITREDILNFNLPDVSLMHPSFSASEKNDIFTSRLDHNEYIANQKKGARIRLFGEKLRIIKYD